MIGKTGITTSDDIDKLMKQLFGDRYIGIYSWQTVRATCTRPKLKDGQIAVLNKDVHWTAVYKKKGKLYEIDSFNRDLLGPRFIDDKVAKGLKQTPATADCGQRMIAKLLYELKNQL